MIVEYGSIYHYIATDCYDRIKRARALLPLSNWYQISLHNTDRTEQPTEIIDYEWVKRLFALIVVLLGFLI